MATANSTTVADVIGEQLAREDLTPDDVLTLTLARRLNEMSDANLTKILAGDHGEELRARRRGLFS